MPKHISKRTPLKMKYKIQRKKRERHRDIRRAAKAMKNAGFKTRSKKSREAAKSVLRLSNSDPEKAELLQRVINARARVREQKKKRRQEAKAGESLTEEQKEELENEEAEEHEELEEDFDEEFEEGLEEDEEDEGDDEEGDEEDGEEGAPVKAPRARQYLLFPGGAETSLSGRLDAILTVAVPSIINTFVVTVDARFAIHSFPEDCVKAIITHSRGTSAEVHIIIVLTKVDLITPTDALEQLGAIDALMHKLTQKAPKVHCKSVLFSAYTDVCTPFIAKTIRTAITTPPPTSGRYKTRCACIFGLPQTGKTTLCKAIHEKLGDDQYAHVPSTGIRIVKRGSEDTDMQVVVPTRKSVTLVDAGSDEAVANSEVVGMDVVFHAANKVERLHDPDVAAALITEAIGIEDICVTYKLALPDEGQNWLYSYAKLRSRLGPSAQQFGLHFSRKREANSSTGKNAARLFLHDVICSRPLKWVVAPPAEATPSKKAPHLYDPKEVSRVLQGELAASLPKSTIRLKSTAIVVPGGDNE